jgi:hypothetical protein
MAERVAATVDQTTGTVNPVATGHRSDRAVHTTPQQLQCSSGHSPHAI